MKFKYPQNKYHTKFLENLLIDRGIFSIEKFLYPTEDCLHDPSLLNNIADGYNMLMTHLEDKIIMIVDCDQDGYTSAAIMYQYIHQLNENVNIEYILHDGKQHGLEDCWEKIVDDDECKLVIIPDAGSNDYEYHKSIKESGKEILILDHHEAPYESEDACVINNQFGDYPNRSLSGAGVVYKFCKYIDNMTGFNYADTYLDLAAIGIIGDMMDVTNLENRYIFKKGLSNIINPCILSIIDKQSFSIGDTSRITPMSVAFYITPLVNALIRVGKPHEKEVLFESLIDGNKIVPSTKRGAKEGATESLAEQNARNCANARSRQNRAKEKAMDLLEMEICKNSLDENKIIIAEVEDDAVDSVLTGLVAMQLVSKYKKPVLVVREDSKGFLKGSGRGEATSELKDFKGFLNDSGFFDFAEGHANAFGVSIEKRHVDAFTQYANEKLKDVDFNEGVYEPDFVFLNGEHTLTEAILSIGSHPEIWGQGNTEPNFVVSNIKLTADDISIIGKNSDTFKFVSNGVTFIKFGAKDLIEDTRGRNNFSLEIIGRANINEWGGTSTPQILIEDYNISNPLFEF